MRKKEEIVILKNKITIKTHKKIISKVAAATTDQHSRVAHYVYNTKD